MPSPRTLTPDVPDEARVLDDLLRNRVLRCLLERLPSLGLPDWWVGGPALAQTIWDVLDDRLPGRRVGSYDVVYHDPRDLTYAGEDAVQSRVDVLLTGAGTRATARNSARGHLRLEEELGVRCAPFGSARHALSSYSTTTSCLAVTHDGRGGLRLHAPHGCADVYARRVRPNPLLGEPARPERAHGAA